MAQPPHQARLWAERPAADDHRHWRKPAGDGEQRSYNGRMLKVDLKNKEITVLADGPGRQSATERAQLTCALPDLAGCPDLRRDGLLHRAGHHDCFIAGREMHRGKRTFPKGQ